MPDSRLALLALVAVALVGAGGPLLGATAACPGGGTGDDCGLDCALCLCCSHVPRPALSEVGVLAMPGGPDELGAWSAPATPAPLPSEILHVPRPSLVR